jgi:hypothetical protein
MLPSGDMSGETTRRPYREKKPTPAEPSSLATGDDTPGSATAYGGGMPQREEYLHY